MPIEENVTETQEAYEEFQQGKQVQDKVVNKFTTTQIIIMGLIFLGVIYSAFFAEIISSTLATVILVGGVVIILVLTNQNLSGGQYITWKEAIVVVKKHIVDLRENEMIPEGHIDILPDHQLKHIEGMPNMWKIGIELTTRYNNKKYYIAGISPLGNMVMWEEQKGGLNLGKPHYKFILPWELKLKQKYKFE